MFRITRHLQQIADRGSLTPQVSSLLIDAPVHAAVEEVLPRTSSRWPISAEFGRVLARIVAGCGARNVLEFGAGASSIVLARALSVAGGGQLTSIEQMPQWCSKEWSVVERVTNVDSQMIVAQPRSTISRLGLTSQFTGAKDALLRRGQYDLVVIDAPQWFFGREGALPLVHASLAAGAWIVLDDAARHAEQTTLLRWLRTYDGLRLVLFEPSLGKGIAVMRFSGERRARLDLATFVSAFPQFVKLLGVRRELQRHAQARRPSANVTC